MSQPGNLASGIDYANAYGNAMSRHNPACDCQTCLMQEVIGLLRFVLQELRQRKAETEIAVAPKPAKRKHER